MAFDNNFNYKLKPGEHLVYLGLGSNLGNRAANLRQGLELLEEGGDRVCGLSQVYLSRPWGGVEQPDFYNMAAVVRTTAEPARLLDRLKAVEHAVGRRPTVVWGPRILDIDILLYDDIIYEDLAYQELTFGGKGLTIPHRELCRRAFVLAPLAELAPELVVPGLERSVSRLLAELPLAERAGVKLLSGDFMGDFTDDEGYVRCRL